MPEPDINAQPESEHVPFPLRQVGARDQIAQAGLPVSGPASAPAREPRTLEQTRNVWSCLRPYGPDTRQVDER